MLKRISIINKSTILIRHFLLLNASLILAKFLKARIKQTLLPICLKYYLFLDFNSLRVNNC